MITASIVTIGDEILIGQIVDTNSSMISRELGAAGIKCSRMISISDQKEDIISSLDNELKNNNIVIVTGGLGPTKDDVTKDALKVLSGARTYVKDEIQAQIVKEILHSRGIDVLESNIFQAMVPDTCRVINNKIGTAPIMVFDFDESVFGHKAILYSMPGVPFETSAALGDVIRDIKENFRLEEIYHKTIMTYGIAESALAEMIANWEDTLGGNIHLAYLPSTLTGVRLRLSIYGCEINQAQSLIEDKVQELKAILGNYIYSLEDSNLEETIGKLLKGTGKTLSAAESCTGGEIAHLITTVSGSSEYFLGSVTSYAIAVKEAVLGVNGADIKQYGVVSSQVAQQMAEGVKKLTGSTYAVSTTGLAQGSDDRNPEGTVWIGVTGPHGTITQKYQYHNDRKRNIERFAATALNMLRLYILEDSI